MQVRKPESPPGPSCTKNGSRSTDISKEMDVLSLLRERFFVHDGPGGLLGLLACA